MESSRDCLLAALVVSPARCENARPMKPRPQSLSRYTLSAAEFDQFPLDWPKVFGREAPLAVEIGFGCGEYLAWWASECPEMDFVGIELPHDCLVRATAELARRDCANVRLLRGDARYLLRELFPSQSLQRVLMQFPMPWPKEKHAKHRVYSPRFAATLADVLVPGGEFELVTDQAWYAAETEQVLGEAGPFSVVQSETGPVREFRTRYEQKWLEMGREISRVVVSLDRPEPAPRMLLEFPMEVVAIDQVPDSQDVDALVGYRAAQDQSVFEVKEVFVSQTGWFLYLVASDESFSQHFYVRLDRKADGRHLLRVHGQPRPYYTPAVRFSLHGIAERLRQVQLAR